MTRRGARGLTALLAVLAWALVCSGCKKQPPRVIAAEVTELSGSVRVQDPTGVVREVSVPAGGRLALRVGEIIVTSEAAAAVVQFPDGRIVRLSEKAELQMLPPAADGLARVQVLMGRAELEGGSDALLISTPRGPARLEPGAKMNVEANGTSARYEVLFGNAVLLDGDKEVVLAPGDGIEIVIATAALEKYRVQIGGAVIEPEPVAAGPDAAVSPDAGVPPDARAEPVVATSAAKSDEAESAGKNADNAVADLGGADVRVAIGETAVIHDARGVVKVALGREAACATGLEAIVTRAGGGRGKVAAVGGPQGAVAVLKPGAYKYRVRCRSAGKRAPGAWQAGGLRVKRDRGTAPLPRYAPKNVLEADGRKYTVLYQSRLPALQIVWPDAPPGGPFTFHVATGKDEAKPEVVDQARVDLPSGTLPEGEHRFWFTGAGTKAQTTVVDIRFDNAATAAQILEPKVGSALDGASTVVAGVALEGSSVTVGGAPIEVDRQGRFRGETKPAAGARAVAIRIEHPRQGVHYYLRR